jgi:periplasmic divalent cation tolerance protein
VYRWKGAVESAREVLLVIKCARERVRTLERHVRAAHPYGVPELVVLAPEHVEARYLAWLLAESRPARGR